MDLTLKHVRKYNNELTVDQKLILQKREDFHFHYYSMYLQP